MVSCDRPLDGNEPVPLVDRVGNDDVLVLLLELANGLVKLVLCDDDFDVEVSVLSSPDSAPSAPMAGSMIEAPHYTAGRGRQLRTDHSNLRISNRRASREAPVNADVFRAGGVGKTAISAPSGTTCRACAAQARALDLRGTGAAW